MRRKGWFFSWLALLGAAFAPVLSVLAEEPAAQNPSLKEPAKDEATDFLRFVDKKPGEGELQTAIVTYTRKNAQDETVEVDLIAAVHVADGKYYRALQERFRGYQRLLYEMVKPKDVAPVPGEHSDNLLSMFQKGLKDVLNLEFQLDGVDYRQENFVHADLDPETFFRLQRQKGESILTLLLSAMRAEFVRQAAGKGSKQVGLLELLAAFSGGDSSRSLKLLLAQQLEDVESLMAGLNGEGGKESVIVSERNKAALKVLAEALSAGKKKVGIFYGAAHMPDFERRLTGELGFKKAKVEWVTAWDIRRQPPPDAGEKVRSL